jgi:hypothetical protein
VDPAGGRVSQPVASSVIEPAARLGSSHSSPSSSSVCVCQFVGEARSEGHWIVVVDGDRQEPVIRVVHRMRRERREVGNNEIAGGVRFYQHGPIDEALAHSDAGSVHERALRSGPWNAGVELGAPTYGAVREQPRKLVVLP